MAGVLSHRELVASCRTASEWCLDEPSTRELSSISDDRVLDFTEQARFSAICNVDSYLNHRSPPQGDGAGQRSECDVRMVRAGEGEGCE